MAYKPGIKSSIAMAAVFASTAIGGYLMLSFGNNKPIPIPAYEVKQVVDGDTFDTMEGQHIRLSAIDAPELDMCGGKEAKAQLAKLITGKKLYLKVYYHDNYYRLMSTVYSEDGLVNTLMLKSGWAELNDRDNLDLPELMAATKDAQANKRGVFSKLCTQTTNPIKPNCNIKANVTTNNVATYHLPGCNSYENVKVQLHHGDKWFCSEREAIKAGFKKAKTCPT